MMGRLKVSGADLRRTGASIGGASAVAATNFLAAALLLREKDAIIFGVFAFMQVVIGLGYGISGALFAAPLSRIANDASILAPERIFCSFARANAWVCILGALFVAIASWLLGLALPLSLLFVTHAFMHWIRWYQRSFGNATHRNVEVARSDLIYGSISGIGLLALSLLDNVNISSVLAVQVIAALASWFLAGAALWLVGLRGAGSGELFPFIDSFRTYGRYALTGVLTTEGTANGHAYLVTLFLGPAAFAPIAAALLLFRPLTLIITVLTQVERPRIAHWCSKGDRPSIEASLWFFGMVVLGAWLVNALVALAVVPAIESQATGEIMIATLLCIAIYLLRSLRSPLSAFMQAAGEFQALTRATVASALATIPIVAILCTEVGAEWSLLGTLVGELIAVLAILISSRRLLWSPRLESAT